MDLQNPACRKQAINDLSGLLKDDWDGIDLAEFLNYWWSCRCA